MFARLVTSCQQVWNKLLTTCNNLVDIIRLVTRLFQQSCYNHDITILLQPCVVLIMSSSFLEVVNNLFQTCYNKLGTSSANTTCWQFVNRLVTTCLQTCNNLCVFTRVQWRSQPEIWSCKCKFFCVYRPYKEQISKEMNNDNNLNLHLHDQMSSWLRYCACSRV